MSFWSTNSLGIDGFVYKCTCWIGFWTVSHLWYYDILLFSSLDGMQRRTPRHHCMFSLDELKIAKASLVCNVFLESIAKTFKEQAPTHRKKVKTQFDISSRMVLHKPNQKHCLSYQQDCTILNDGEASPPTHPPLNHWTNKLPGLVFQHFSWLLKRRQPTAFNSPKQAAGTMQKNCATPSLSLALYLCTALADLCPPVGRAGVYRCWCQVSLFQNNLALFVRSQPCANFFLWLTRWKQVSSGDSEDMGLYYMAVQIWQPKNLLDAQIKCLAVRSSAPRENEDWHWTQSLQVDWQWLSTVNTDLGRSSVLWCFTKRHSYLRPSHWKATIFVPESLR